MTDEKQLQEDARGYWDSAIGRFPVKESQLIEIIAHALREDRKRRDLQAVELEEILMTCPECGHTADIEMCIDNRDSLEADLVALGEQQPHFDLRRSGDGSWNIHLYRISELIGIRWHDTPRAAVKAALKEVK